MPTTTKGIANVPPLAQPIKPRFKKKSNSLLNKLIYSTKKEDDETATSGKESRSSSIISDENAKVLAWHRLAVQDKSLDFFI